MQITHNTELQFSEIQRRIELTEELIKNYNSKNKECQDIINANNDVIALYTDYIIKLKREYNLKYSF